MNKLLWVLITAFVISIVVIPVVFVLGLAEHNYLLALGVGVGGSILIGVLFIMVVSVLMYYLWKAIPRSFQVVITVLLIALTVAFFQPELAVIDVVAVVLTIMGNTKSLPGQR